MLNALNVSSSRKALIFVRIGRYVLDFFGYNSYSTFVQNVGFSNGLASNITEGTLIVKILHKSENLGFCLKKKSTSKV